MEKQEFKFYGETNEDIEYKVVHNLCDICNDRILECPDNIEEKINLLEEINNSYLDEYGKNEPSLLLCKYCQKEYLIPGYPLM